MTLKDTILVYITTSLSTTGRQALLSEFNHPQRPISAEVTFGLADTNAVGEEVEKVVLLHTAASSQAARPTGINKTDDSLIIVADNGVSASTLPQTVLIVKILEQSSELRVGEHQAIRVLVSNAAEVLATISNGRHGWEDYWKIAQANGGHFPGE